MRHAAHSARRPTLLVHLFFLKGDKAMLRRSSFVAGLMMVLMVSMASAQQRGGRGGFGGPGMRGPGFGRGGMSSAMLLRIPEVREELGTNEEQNAKIDEILDEMQESMQAAFGNPQDFQNLSEEERGKHLAEMQKKNEATTKKTDAAIAKVLDKKQLTRLNQLQLQREGVNAFHRPDVAKQLDLTEEQETKMQEVEAKAAEGRPAFGNFQQLSDEERQEMFTKMQERQKKREADLLAVLTEDQQAKWAEMQGEKFDFPQQGFVGFGGPGGGRGPGAGGRGPGGGGRGAGGERRRPPVKDSEE